MSTLTWTDALAVQQPAMDLTHHAFVEHLAAVEAGLAADATSDPMLLDRALDALLRHTVEHFAQEERWMAALGFDAANCHAYQHAHVLQVLREVNDFWRHEGDAALVRQLVQELARWFPVHAQSMDAPLARLLAERDSGPTRGAAGRSEIAPATGCAGTPCP